MNAIEREEIEVDVLIVGAGPTGLACGYKLAELYESAEASEVNPPESTSCGAL